MAFVTYKYNFQQEIWIAKNTGFTKCEIYPLVWNLGIAKTGEKIPETNVLATLLTGNAWLFNELNISWIYRHCQQDNLE